MIVSGTINMYQLLKRACNAIHPPWTKHSGRKKNIGDGKPPHPCYIGEVISLLVHTHLCEASHRIRDSDLRKSHLQWMPGDTCADNRPRLWVVLRICYGTKPPSDVYGENYNQNQAFQLERHQGIYCINSCIETKKRALENPINSTLSFK